LTRSISLRALFLEIPVRVFSSIPEAIITGVSLDSRAVKPGDLFVALAGERYDGHRFIPQAVARGAAAVVGTQPGLLAPVPYVQVENSRTALAYLAAVYFGHPARRLTVIGVTGTDGKTTTCNLIYNILRTAGLSSGMISTVNAVIGDQVLDTGFHVTTPEAPAVQDYLARMVAAGLQYVVLEATSHGLAQDRLTACEFDLGVVTNITHEHLDYHGSYESYRAAKGLLFTALNTTPDKDHRPPRLAVLNRDDQSFVYLAALTNVRQVAYGEHAGAAVRAEGVERLPHGQRFQAVGPDFRVPVETSLAGAYNRANCLAALAATVTGLQVAPEAARQGIAGLPPIPGRLERVELGQDFTAIVDFAHTPNALRRVLETGRELTAGRVIAVFGSAGLRDREKRRLMAEISARLADLTVLTAEDPRTESLEGILAEMAAGAEAAGGVEGRTFWRIPDRGEALHFAIGQARPGDVLLACGKGHEQSMCFGEIEYPWDDRTALRAALSDFMRVPGPEMPYLPTRAG
jgi:UDP-N-acetylmuramoyl-L-alanyl-D-glutamate--2,6-diaminopimelate ligase